MKPDNGSTPVPHEDRHRKADRSPSRAADGLSCLHTRHGVAQWYVGGTDSAMTSRACNQLAEPNPGLTATLGPLRPPAGPVRAHSHLTTG
jgi:hypothetical protein